MDIQYSPVSVIVLILTVGVSLYTLFKDNSIIDKYALHPWSFYRENKWYQLITSGFLHGDMSHLIFNMLTFFFFAFQLEATIGSFRFAIVYFVSMVLADVSSLIKNKNNPKYRSLGASGGIAGVLFSYILFYPTSSIYMMFLPIGIPAPIFALMYLAYCYWAGKKAQDNINHEAHFWGAAAGLILTVILIPDVIPYFIESVF